MGQVDESTYTGVILKGFSPAGSRANRRHAVKVQIRCALDPFDFAQGRLFASSG